MTPAEIIAKRRMRVLLRNDYRGLLFRLLLAAFFVWLLLTQVLLLTQARGNDMYPAIKDGDLLIVYRLHKNYVRDDVVVFTMDQGQMLGRIVAAASDVVTLGDDGKLIVNGTVMTNQMLFSSMAKEGIDYPYTVPEGHVFVMGDYRIQATDSREFGSLPVSALQGKVITIMRRQGL